MLRGMHGCTTRFEIARKNWPLVQNILDVYGVAECFVKDEINSSDQVIVFELQREIVVELYLSLRALAG
jgi:hypothetical protein